MTEEILITGANGWIGGKLAQRLHDAGWRVTGASRTPEAARSKRPELNWVGVDQELDEAVRRAGVVVNLAGRHLLEQPWDDAFKKAMYESRVDLTKRIVSALEQSASDEKVLISGSGYPVYGDTGDAALAEDAPVSRASFLYALDADWEDAARAAEAFGARVALLRIGLVFGADGGAFPVLKQPFDEGMGIVLGSGAQWIPWIHIDDLVRLAERAVADARYAGPINAVAPNPVQHDEFARALAGALGKPCEVTVPAPQVRETMGEAAELVLMSSRLKADRAAALGFDFQHPQFAAALPSLLA